MIRQVQPRRRRLSSTSASVTGSSALVASSRIKRAGFFSRAAGELHALPLAPREVPAPSDSRARIRYGDGRSRGGSRHPSPRGHLAFGDGIVPERQVVADGPAKEKRLVVNHADLVGEHVARDSLDGEAVIEDLSLPGTEESGRELADGRLAAAGASDQRHAAPRPDRERQPLDQRLIDRAVEAEGHVAELEPAREPLRACTSGPTARRR